MPIETATCRACGASFIPGSRFCSACGASLAVEADATRLAADTSGDTQLASASAPPRSGAAAGRSGKPTSGWLSSSGSIDHGRFQPGAILDGRYRIIGLLGRGGMGEVYRADDLRLGQPVALKFLPDALSRDAARLAQFHNEVRTARHVSHPNVCRVYDIGEIDGQLFLTMEFVDGEDLATSLRRIGRFPEDKALQIARQLCAGLAAAHERGVLHRDLKPANVMLDGAGNVRIMDFGLAAIGDVDQIRAGTPAYMAPEQLAGREVTARSDIYALGLLLYELFTGRRALTGSTIAELVQQHADGTITAPTEIVGTIDPVIERALLRCLDRDPGRRPASALTVSAALPGGDPLAAALAAGETPSPEMVAAAGDERATLGRAAAAAMFVAVIVGLGVIAGIVDRTSLEARVPLTKSRDVLIDRALEARLAAGYTEPYADTAFGFRNDEDYLRWAVSQGEGARRWRQLSAGRPAAIWFWQRTSPLPLLPLDDESPPGLSDPPLLVSGMTLVKLDTQGRLLEFQAVPPQVEGTDNGPAPEAAPWDRLLAAAGLDAAALAEAVPTWTPPAHADERRAWTATLPELPDHPIRIEAAAYRGRPVFFQTIGPWSRPTRQAPPPASRFRVATIAAVCIIAAIPILAAIAARRNVKSGRGDRVGAMRLSVFVLALVFASWVVSTAHVSDWQVELQDRYFGMIGFALINAGLLYLAYLALEPTVRRTAPHMLVGWSRMLQGRLPDPIIGRDIAIGAVAGLMVTLLAAVYGILPGLAGLPDPRPFSIGNPGALYAIRPVVYQALTALVWALQNGLVGVLVFALVLRLVGNVRIAAVIMTVVWLLLSLRGGVDSGYFWFDIGYTLALTMLVVGIILRYGLLAAVALYYVHILTTTLPVTLDGTKVYFGSAMVTMGAVALLVVAAIWMARGGEGFSAPAARPAPGR